MLEQEERCTPNSSIVDSDITKMLGFESCPRLRGVSPYRPYRRSMATEWIEMLSDVNGWSVAQDIASSYERGRINCSKKHRDCFFRPSLVNSSIVLPLLLSKLGCSGSLSQQAGPADSIRMRCLLLTTERRLCISPSTT